MVDSPIEQPAQVESAVSDEVRHAVVAAAAAAEPKPGDPDARFILYLGPRNLAANAEALKKRRPKLGEATATEITAEQWRQVGVAAERTLVWNVVNSWRIPTSQLSDAQISYLLTNSKRFELVDGLGRRVDN